MQNAKCKMLNEIDNFVLAVCKVKISFLILIFALARKSTLIG